MENLNNNVPVKIHLSTLIKRLNHKKAKLAKQDQERTEFLKKLDGDRAEVAKEIQSLKRLISIHLGL